MTFTTAPSISPSPASPEAIQWLAERRALLRDGKALTREEMRIALELLRQGRVKAQATSTKSRTAKAPIDSDDLLAGL